MEHFPASDDLASMLTYISASWLVTCGGISIYAWRVGLLFLCFVLVLLWLSVYSLFRTVIASSILIVMRLLRVQSSFTPLALQNFRVSVHQ